MGVEVRAMLYVGRFVDDAEEYLIEKGFLKENQLHEECDGDFDSIPDLPIQVQRISYYSDEGYYVGFEVCPSEYKRFDDLLSKFKSITGDEAEVCSFEQWW